MAPVQPPPEKPFGVCLTGPDLAPLATKGLGAAVSRRDDKGERKKKRGPISTDEEYVPRASEIFAAIGEKLYKRNELRRAMSMLDVAVELDPNDKRPYLTRAACLIRLGRYNDALEELDKTEDPKGTRALVLRTVAYWNMGEFEKAAYTAARGVRKGGSKLHFKANFYTAIGSIERCIGPSAGEIMLEMSKDIFQMEEQRKKPQKPVPNRVSTRNRRCAEYKQKRSMYLMQLHLGRLAVDNRFISGLQDNAGYFVANESGVAKVDRLIDCAKFEMLTRLEEMLMDMPMYYHRRVAIIPKSAKMRALDEERIRKTAEDASKKAEDLLIKILKVREKGVLLDSTNAAARAAAIIRDMPKKMLPEKYTLLTLIYHLLGIILLEGHQRVPDASDVANHKRILQWLGLKRSLLQALLHRSKFPFLDCRKEIKNALHKYPLATSHLQRAWLLYIISFANAAYSNYDGCRNHARRCVVEARLGGSDAWVVLGLIMQAHSELHLNSKLDAKTSIRDALDTAQKLHNEDVIEFLIEMNAAIEQQSAEADTAAEEARFHKSLVAMMPTQAMKNKMRQVLHHRSCMPPQKRLHISVRRDTAPNLGDTAEDADRAARPLLWPRKKKSV